MTTLTYEEAVSLLTDIVVGKGEDYVYAAPYATDTCLYVHGQQPGCIMGHLFVALGHSLDEISKFEGYDVIGVAAHLGYDLNSRVSRLLIEVQDRQDGRKPWGLALDESTALIETDQYV